MLGALRAESERLYEQVSGLPEAEWERPSPCPPWSVREVFAHLTAGLERVGAMLDAAPPVAVGELSTAVDHYAQDVRFTCTPDGRSVELAADVGIDAPQRYAAGFGDGRALAEHFDGVWRAVVERCAGEPASRVVVTRPGEAMLLGEFLLTRVVEVCVHGFDVAWGLGHAPWPSGEAAAVVCRLLLGRELLPGELVLGWDRTTLLRKATGRLPMTAVERVAARRAGVRWLTLR